MTFSFPYPLSGNQCLDIKEERMYGTWIFFPLIFFRRLFVIAALNMLAARIYSSIRGIGELGTPFRLHRQGEECWVI